ncbi:hypothetical protein J6590_026180 [Homalodisca vitripennis]|nr:hypothetical protein J6590_026180 [Homalodisca vitripennis]
MVTYAFLINIRDFNILFLVVFYFPFSLMLFITTDVFEILVFIEAQYAHQMHESGLLEYYLISEPISASREYNEWSKRSAARRSGKRPNQTFNAHNATPPPLPPITTYSRSRAQLKSSNCTWVFVANLDYKVDDKKLRDVFKLAGRVHNAEISVDKEGKSRGFGVVEFEHPVEAGQAISRLHNQMLYDRRLSVRMDRVGKPDE